jgi:hypothetical protein
MKRYKYFLLFVLSLLFLISLISCESLKRKNLPGESVSSSEKDYANKEIVDKVLGCLVLTDKEKEKVIELVQLVVDLKSKSFLEEHEKTRLNELNKNLSDLLNKYTLEKVAPKVKNLQKIKDSIANYRKSSRQPGLPKIQNNNMYKIEDNEIVILENSVALEDQKIYREMWKNIKKIFPKSALREIVYFQPFKLESDNTSKIGGFYTLSDDEECVLGVNISVSSEELPHILLHEYGHAISLNSSQRENNIVDYNSSYENCKFKEDSYMKAYYHKFMEYTYEISFSCSDEDLYLFYLRHQKNFYSVYAASNFMEDFAESFACFMIERPENVINLLEKIKFFSQYPVLLELRKEAHALWKKNAIKPTKATF